MNDAGRAREATRQKALLAAILAQRADVSGVPLRERGARAERGLAAYRANAEALAERALGSAFGGVRALLGAEDFVHVAAEYWRAEPPRRGDVGEWGDGFADWLERHAQLAAWPYLADCARLDLALHRNERAADAAFDAASLALLQQADPAELRLELMPGSALIESRWPIVLIHRANTTGDEADFAAARALIDKVDTIDTADAPRGESAFVVREGWRAQVVALDAARAAWTRALLDGADLASALDRAGDGFDFAGWLADAIGRRWLKGVARIAD